VPFLFGNVALSHINPIIPDSMDAINTEIFELTIVIFSLNASSVINIDMVKPIPASSPTPIRCFILISSGREHKPIATPKTEKIKITLKSPEKGPFEIKPRIVCVDETGQQISYDIGSVYDVFISYSKNDKKIADAICSTLESQEIRCWIAPRNVWVSKPYLVEIIHALNNSQIFVLVFSNSANQSNHVIRETELAVNRGIPIIPFRIENVLPIESMEYLISTSQWLDATTPPLEKHLQKLAETVRALLANNEEASDSNPPQSTLCQPS